MSKRNMSDKRWHWGVTVISLVLALAIYQATRGGWLGERMADFSTAYLATMLCILGVRAILTEMGIRRARQPDDSRIRTAL